MSHGTEYESTASNQGKPKCSDAELDTTNWIDVSNLPVYSIDIADGDSTGVESIAFVDTPPHGVPFMYYQNTDCDLIIELEKRLNDNLAMGNIEDVNYDVVRLGHRGYLAFKENGIYKVRKKCK